MTTEPYRPQTLTSKLAHAAQTQINEQKNRFAGRAGQIAHAVRQTASQLREPSPAVAVYVDRAADRLDELVRALRDRDAAELVDDVRTFARERPALVIGGGFALGLLAARFLKSSSRNAGAFHYDYTSEGSLT